MDHEFKQDFVTVYGFNFAAAAADLGVSVQTVLRWYEQKPNPLAKRLLRIIARGYLPDYAPFTDWRIVGTTVTTPYGIFDASEVEYLQAFKWNARTYAARFRQLPEKYNELEQRVNVILEQSDEIKAIIKRMNGG